MTRVQSCSRSLRPSCRYASTSLRSREATYRVVCSKRATLRGNLDELTESCSGAELDVKRPDIRIRGTLLKYHSRIFWIDGRRTRAAAKAPQRKRPCRSRATARRSLLPRSLAYERRTPLERDDVESCRFFQLSTSALICASFSGVNFICPANRATLPSPRFASELLGVTVNFLQTTCSRLDIGLRRGCRRLNDGTATSAQLACSKRKPQKLSKIRSRGH